MNKAELSALAKRVLTELPGFASREQLIFMHPIRDTLLGIFFDRSASPRAFYVQLFAQPLFIPKEHIVFTLGWRIGGGSWDADAPELLAKLGDALKGEAVPFLSKIKSPSDVAKVAIELNEPGDLNLRRVIAYSLARSGETEKAIHAFKGFLQTMPAEIKADWLKEDAQRAELLLKELQTDPEATQRRLQAWEKETLKNLRLEKFA